MNIAVNIIFNSVDGEYNCFKEPYLDYDFDAFSVSDIPYNNSRDNFGDYISLEDYPNNIWRGEYLDNISRCDSIGYIQFKDSTDHDSSSNDSYRNFPQWGS